MNLRILTNTIGRVLNAGRKVARSGWFRFRGGSGSARWLGGVQVDMHSALYYSAVFGCVRIISQSIAMLPAAAYRRNNNSRELMRDHVVSWILGVQANPEMSAMTFLETIIAHALTWGNGYAEIERDQAGRPLWLWLIPPDRVIPDRDQNTGEKVYRVYNWSAQDPAARTGEIIVPAADMFHVHGLGFDGLMGYSPIELARRSVAMGLAMDKFGEAFYANGTMISGTFEAPNQLSEQAYNRLKQALAEEHGGVGAKSAMGALVLEEGVKWNNRTMPLADAEFLGTRRFQVGEICRWYGVPPHKLADLERATFTNIEEQNTDFVIDCLLPWITRIEQEANIKLFGRVNRGVHYVKFTLSAFLRGDMASRYAAFATGHQNGWLSADEIREFEDMNPIADGSGKRYFVQSSLVPRDSVDAMIDRRTQSDRRGTPEQEEEEPEEHEAPTAPGTTPTNDKRVEEITRRLRVITQREQVNG